MPRRTDQCSCLDSSSVSSSPSTSTRLPCLPALAGRMGLLGNLMASQIVEQLVLARRHLAEAGDPTPIQRMVFMGMGASWRLQRERRSWQS